MVCLHKKRISGQGKGKRNVNEKEGRGKREEGERGTYAGVTSRMTRRISKAK